MDNEYQITSEPTNINKYVQHETQRPLFRFTFLLLRSFLIRNVDDPSQSFSHLQAERFEYVVVDEALESYSNSPDDNN